jgi:hypothetical protein
MNLPCTSVAIVTTMRESTNRETRPNREQPTSPGADGGDRKRSSHQDRRDAIRRWIDDDDDSACRGID